MPNVTLFIPNLRAAAFTAGGGFTVDAAYPLTNLLAGLPEDPVKSTATTDAQRIIFNQGSAKSFDSVVLLNHNFTTNDGLRIRAASNEAISADVEEVFAAATPSADGDLVISDLATFTKQYIAAEWVKGSALAEVPRLGAFYVCAKYVFPWPWEFGASDGFYSDYSHIVKSTSISGIGRSSLAHGGWPMMTFNYHAISNADRQMIQLLFDTVQGPNIPFVITDDTGAIFYGKFENTSIKWQTLGYNINTLREPLQFKAVRATMGVTTFGAATETVSY